MIKCLFILMFLLGCSLVEKDKHDSDLLEVAPGSTTVAFSDFTTGDDYSPESDSIYPIGKTSFGREWDGSLMPGESMNFEAVIPLNSAEDAQ